MQILLVVLGCGGGGGGECDGGGGDCDVAGDCGGGDCDVGGDCGGGLSVSPTTFKSVTSGTSLQRVKLYSSSAFGVALRNSSTSLAAKMTTF